MAFYPRKKLTDLWKKGVAIKDCICSCCKEDVVTGTYGWISHKKPAVGYYPFLCFLCYDTWTAGDVGIGLAKISRFKLNK